MNIQKYSNTICGTTTTTTTTNTTTTTTTGSTGNNTMFDVKLKSSKVIQMVCSNT